MFDEKITITDFSKRNSPRDVGRTICEISGDKDFQPINITRPEILTISEFMEKYDRDAS